MQSRAESARSAAFSRETFESTLPSERLMAPLRRRIHGRRWCYSAPVLPDGAIKYFVLTEFWKGNDFGPLLLCMGLFRAFCFEPIWLSLFVGNLVSTQLLGWWLVPTAFKALDWWVTPKAGFGRQIAGYALLAALYGASMGLYALLLTWHWGR